MKNLFLVSIILAGGLFGCQKSEMTLSGIGTGNSTNTNTLSKKILVDASKDGGAWWFPQYGSYSANIDHQGKALADYLRGLGYQVDELPRGATITTAVLNNYSNVIRAVGFFDYAPAELDAYKSFLSRQTSLLLVNDHMTNTQNDALSAYLGLNFEGAHWGPVTSFQSHAITAGVTSIPYIAGSVVRNWDPSKITVLGSLPLTGGLPGSAVAAMGIVNQPSSRIFFIGDIGGIEQVHQPFVSNLTKWLFR